MGLPSPTCLLSSSPSKHRALVVTVWETTPLQRKQPSSPDNKYLGAKERRWTSTEINATEVERGVWPWSSKSRVNKSFLTKEVGKRGQKTSNSWNNSHNLQMDTDEVNELKDPFEELSPREAGRCAWSRENTQAPGRLGADAPTPRRRVQDERKTKLRGSAAAPVEPASQNGGPAPRPEGPERQTGEKRSVGTSQQN